MCGYRPLSLVWNFAILYKNNSYIIASNILPGVEILNDSTVSYELANLSHEIITVIAVTANQAYCTL